MQGHFACHDVAFGEVGSGVEKVPIGPSVGAYCLFEPVLLGRVCCQISSLKLPRRRKSERGSSCLFERSAARILVAMRTSATNSSLFARPRAIPARSSVLSVRRLRSVLTFLSLVTGHWLLVIGSLQAAPPYTPVHPDPELEPWRWRVYHELDGLGLKCVTEDSEGHLWFGSGAHRYDGSTWTMFSFGEGLTGSQVMRLTAAPNGDVYAGTDTGIHRFANGVWSKLFPEDADIGV